MDQKAIDELLRKSILKKASEKKPVALIQFDGFFREEYDSVITNMGPWRSQTVELFNKPWDVRFFVTPGTSKKKIIEFLKELLKCFKSDEQHLLEFTSTSLNSNAVLDPNGAVSGTVSNAVIAFIDNCDKDCKNCTFPEKYRDSYVKCYEAKKNDTRT